MKKKIAVFANGWSTEFLRIVLEGVRKRAFQLNIDVYLFLSYATEIRGELYSSGENNIFKLPDLSDFDGIILFPNTFNTKAAIEYFENKLKECGTPAISIEYPMEGIDYIVTDNYNASYELACHLIEVHNVKNVVYMGGVNDNKDTIERFNAISDAFRNSGIDIPKDNVVYGYFAYQVSRNAIKQWLEQHDYLPDAIMCANDEMALGVCVQLSSMNIRVPEDVIVTGYDKLEVSQRFIPSITSVYRSWDEIGSLAIEHLLDKMAGKDTNPYIYLESKPVYKESCGCSKCDSGETNQHMKDIIISKYTHSRESVLADEMISLLCQKVAEQPDIASIAPIVYKTMEFYDFLYGNVMKIYLNKEYIILDEDIDITDNYSDKMYCPCDVDESGTKKQYMIRKADILSRLESSPGNNHFFIFLPIHNQEKSIGFIVFDDTLQHIYDYSFNSANMHITAAVEKICQSVKLISANKKLRELSERDNLTGVYNRMAYDSYAVPLVNNMKKQGKKSIIMIVDIDKMKNINDQFGHLQGDVAIKIVAKTLTETFPLDWKIIRYGGDEFFLVGESKLNYEIDHLADVINSKITKYVEKEKIQFKLSVSIGAVEILPEDKNDIDFYFKEADRSMYKMKYFHHRDMTY